MTVTGHDDPDDIVGALVAKMTVAEKVGQLFGVWLGAGAGSTDVAPMQHEHAKVPADWDELIKHGIGQLTRPYGTVPVEPLAGARALATTQRAIVAAGRFAIPALVHEETLTGLAAWQAAVFPSPLCWGASFDPELVERMGARIGATMRRLGVHQALAPVLDVARDLRWGRVEETIGEDPLLVGLIGSAYVRGLQSAGVIATLKHFLGYSASRAGRNLAPVSIGPRELAEVLLPPFELALRAGAHSVMNSYADLDGMPVAADETVLTELLRNRLGFSGTVVADYFSIAFLQSLHGLAADTTEAAELALTAGIDVELPSMECFGPELIAAVEDGEVEEALLDRALLRVLRQKQRLGLLDPDWTPEPPLLTEPGTVMLDTEADRAVARELAQRSIVLLDNDGTLPLKPGSRIAVVGPRSNTAQAMLGCYSFPLHVGVHHPEVPLGIEIPTVLDALRADPAAYDVSHRLGCPVLGGTDEEILAAVEVASAAEVCIAVLGDQAGLFGGGTSGEGNDVGTLRLPGRQEELLEALLATGTPVVLVLMVGRPYELARQQDRLAAVLCTFFPGEEGAAALADVLSGRLDPSGRLPVSFPSIGTSQPASYLGARLAHRSEVSEVDPSPLYPFGHGLSYAPAEWVRVRGDSAPWVSDGTTSIQVQLRNNADHPVSEVVQVYLHDPVAQVARSVQQLIAAVRVDLEPGAMRTVTLELHADQTSYIGRAGDRIVDTGKLELWVGASSTDIRQRISLAMTGPVRTVGFDRVLTPTVSLD